MQIAHVTCDPGIAGHPEAAGGSGGAAQGFGDQGRETGEGAERRSRYDPIPVNKAAGLSPHTKVSAQLAFQAKL